MRVKWEGSFTKKKKMIIVQWLYRFRDDEYLKQWEREEWAGMIGYLNKLWGYPGQ